MPYSTDVLYGDTAQVQHTSQDLFGSGRLIGRNLVLTARHVVTAEGADAPIKDGWQVRLTADRPDPPEASKWEWIKASVAWVGQAGLDLALLEVHPKDGASDYYPKLKLRISQIDEVLHRRVRGLGFPRGAKVDSKRLLFVPSGDLDDQKGVTLSFGIDQAYQPESPNRDWRGFSGAAVLLEESLDPEVVWIYGVVQQVPKSFTRQLAVARLANSWNDASFRAILEAAGSPLVPPTDPAVLSRSDRGATQKDITTYTTPVYGKRDYAAEVEDLFEFYGRLFVDREFEMSQLVALANEGAGGYTVLESPPAFGKSALVVRVIRQLRLGVTGADVKPRVIYFFVRQQGNRNTATEFLSVVNAQLLTELGVAGGVPPDLGALRAQFTELWLRSCSQSDRHRPLMLFVDGIDEAAEEQASIPHLLPVAMRPWVQAVVTCRIDTPASSLVPLEHPLQNPSRTVQLTSFKRGEVAKLLDNAGASALGTGTIPDRILGITEGEPLMTRFVCEELAIGGVDVLVRLESAPPKGAKEYFAQQLQQLQANAQYPLTRNLLGLLLVALGSITIEELADVMNVAGWDAEQAIRPVRRFLIGRERLELMHPYFRRELERLFTRREQAKNSRLLLDWCKKYETYGFPEDTPDYVLSRYVEHLRVGEDFERIYNLIGPAWMRRRWTQTSSYSGYVDDVLSAMDAAASEQPPNLFQQIRAALLVGQVVSGLDDLHPAALAAIARINQVERALSYAALIQDSAKRVAAWLRVANACREAKVDAYWSARPAVQFSKEERSGFWEIVERITEDVKKVHSSRIRADQMSQFASLLASVQEHALGLHIAEIAFAAALHVEEPGSRAAALVGVAGAYADTGARDGLGGILDKFLEAASGLLLWEQNTLRVIMGAVLSSVGLDEAAADLMKPVDLAVILDAIKASDWRGDVSFDLVRAYLALGKEEFALAVASASSIALRRAANLAQIALNNREHGRVDADIERLLNEALGRWLDEKERTPTDENSILEQEYSSGHTSRSLTIALPEQLANEEQVVSYMVASGRIDILGRNIRKFSRPEQRRLLAVLSEGLAKAGKNAEAEATADQSLDLTDDDDLDRAWDEFRMDAGSRLADLGAPDEAVHIATSIRNRGRRRLVDAALAMESERRGETAKAAAYCASAVAGLPAGTEDRIVVGKVVGVRLKLRDYDTALELSSTIQNKDVHIFALALVADHCLREGAPQGKEAMNALLEAMRNFTSEDQMSTDTLDALVPAMAAAGWGGKRISDFATALAGSGPIENANALWLLPSVLWNLSTAIDSTTLRENAHNAMRERLASADAFSSDPWQRMAAYGIGMRLMERAGLQAEAETAAGKCVTAFREGVAQYGAGRSA